MPIPVAESRHCQWHWQLRLDRELKLKLTLALGHNETVVKEESKKK
jgi:hypothetical protein